MGVGLYAGLAHRQSPLAMQEAIRNLAVYHISAVRMNKVRGITFVKHIAFGWMSVKDYYRLQKLHDLMPLILQFIQGGYRMKLAIAQTTFSAATITVPVGALFYVLGFIVGSVAATNPDPNVKEWGWIALLATFAPFGEPILVVALAALGIDLVAWLGSSLVPVGPAFLDRYRELWGQQNRPVAAPPPSTAHPG